jgi:DNA replicative helicase MCM subunit Mcm2 (Cdc46/Mcm family)
MGEMERRRRRSEEDERRLTDEASYVCGSCGEEIVVPLDPSAGASQQYVEDCPVCCSPNEVSVDYDEDGSARVTSRPE